jgi:CDGSH-type Zn-finger protein
MSEAVAAQEGLFAVALRAGTNHAWRGCGRSATRPVRDRSHERTSGAPVVSKAEPHLCGCGTSQGRPYCDRSHDRP